MERAGAIAAHTSNGRSASAARRPASSSPSSAIASAEPTPIPSSAARASYSWAKIGPAATSGVVP